MAYTSNESPLCNCNKNRGSTIIYSIKYIFEGLAAAVRHIGRADIGLTHTGLAVGLTDRGPLDMNHSLVVGMLFERCIVL